MEANVEYEEYRKRMEPFPCAFNLVGTDKVTTAKLRAIQHNLDSELDINDGCEQERIIKLNLLTWVRFRLGKDEEALQLSRDVIESTKRRNVASLANCSFIMWQSGDEVEAMKCLKDLDEMKSENTFQTQFTNGQAEQAYYYSRLGGPNNLQRAINLFCDLPKTPINYLRTFGLGLVYRRMTHMSIVCSSSEHLTVGKYQKMAAKCLFEVAENADDRLRSLAYAQLATLRRNYQCKLSPEDEAMFRGLGVEKLCDKAIEHGQNIPTVLVECGKAIKPFNIDKAIDWLSKSIAIKGTSAAYHHLGICFRRKADEAAKGQRYQGSTSEKLPGRDYVGQLRVDRHIPGQSTEVLATYAREHRWPADGSTVNQPLNNTHLYKMEGYRQDSFNAEYGSRRFGSCNYQPQNVSGRYPQQEFQTEDVPNIYGAVNDQHVASNYQYEQRHGQQFYEMDGKRYLRYKPPQMYFVYGQMSRYLYMNLTPVQMYDQTVQDGHEYKRLPVENQYLSGVEEQCYYQNVETDGAPCVNDDIEIGSAYGPVHGGAVAVSLTPESRFAESMHVAPCDAERTEKNQEYRQKKRGCRQNARRNRSPRGHAQSTGGNHYNTRNGRLNRGRTQSFRGENRPVRGTSLARGNAQSMGSDAQNNSHHRGERTSSSGCEPKTTLKGCVRRCRSVLTLKIDDENVQKARKCFEMAIEIAKENLSAILDLGILLKDANQIADALKQFNSITNSSNSLMNRMIVISAYEQAGLCYLELSRTEGIGDYREIGKNKLTKAVSIAADLIHTMPELQGTQKDVWIAFTTLLDEIDKEQTPENLRLIEKFKVLELARVHGDIIDVIQKLKETGHDELTNPEIVKPALVSFLQEGQSDNALGYHNVVAMNPLVQDSDWWNAEPMRSLRIKVLLHAIAGRLMEARDDNPTVLFRQLFEFIFGSCVGLLDPENDQQTDSASVVLGDVLFIFESDENPDEENIYPTVKSARSLKRLTTCLFGLVASENVKGTGEYGDRNIIQLKEMLNYQIVLIVLGNEERDGYFNAMLQMVSYNSQKAPPNQKILVINTGQEDDNIPLCLKQYKFLKLGDIDILGDQQRIPESWSDTDNIPYTEIIHHVFDDDVDAILKLFCFMIEQTWPCP